jgi:translation initiation factor 1A
MSSKGKGGKKHRRAKNTTILFKVDIPDSFQYFAYVTKILGSGRVTVDYYKPIFNDKNDNIDWDKHTKIGVIRGKMLRRKFVNLGDLVLVTERDFDTNKVDIIDKYDNTQIPYLKKNAHMPPIDELVNNDIEFDFEDEDGEDVKYVKNTKNDDYMSGIPSFSSEDGGHDGIENI